MSIQTVYVLIGVFAAILAGLYIFVIYSKIAQAHRTKVQVTYTQTIRPAVEDLSTAPDADYSELHQTYVAVARKNMKKKAYHTALEAILLEYLEESGQERRQRVLKIAYDLELPCLCLAQIESRNNRNVAFGCRKAGLYQYVEAVPRMLGALSILSSETQFQILMGLSRIGDVNAMCQAFNTISRYIMANERAVSEILEAFPGNKQELFQRMIHSEEEYVAALFIKSLDRDVMKFLAGDITGILESGGKEMRIAAIKAIGSMDENIPIVQLREALTDEDWEVRAMAAKALGAQVDPEGGAALATALHDPEWWVRQNAAFALLSYPDCEELFLSMIETKDAYARDSIVNALESAEKSYILVKIQQALADIAEEENVEYVAEFLKDRDYALPV